MSEVNDGGNAFPTVEFVDGAAEVFDRGMTLRDYFAAKAITGVLCASWPGEPDRKEIARIAYCMADAMLEARK